MMRAQSSWLFGLIAGLLLAAVLWFGLTQAPFAGPNVKANSPSATPTSAAALDRTSCIQAAVASASCIANGSFQRNATFTYGNQTYPCHCNTPESDGTENLTAPRPWSDENEPQPSIEPWPDPDRIQSTVVAGPQAKTENTSNASSQPESAEQITSGPGSDQNPAFLDGNTLIFTRFSQGYNQGPAAIMGVYVKNKTEFVVWQDEAQNVNTNGNPFTPDKKQICYASDVEDTDEIWCLDLATKNRTRITHHNETSQFIEPSVSNDGKQIAFEMHVESEFDNPGQIWVADVSGNAQALIADNADNRLPQYNPSDGRLLLQRRTGIPEQNAFQLVIRQPNATLETLSLSTAGGTDASWAGTNEIVYSSEDERFPQAKIFSYNLATKTGRQETFDPAFEDGAPAVFLDGVWLAFERHTNEDPQTPTRIWIVQRQ